MPRRPVPNVSVPSRPDRRRQRGNGTDAQRRPRRARPGQVEMIAERRAFARALTGGLAVTEFDPLGKGADEMREFWQWVAQQMQMRRKRHAEE